MGILVLQRKHDERIFIGDDIIITVVAIREGFAVRLGIEAPAGTPVHREEIREAILRREKVDRLDAIPQAPRESDDAIEKMARNILATTVEHSGTHAMRAVAAELLRMKGVAA